MLLALSIMMFILPALFSVVIHNYLRHGELSGKRKLEFFVVYLVLINFFTFSVSYFRGVKGFRFSDMTLSYRLKYMSLGGVMGFVMPFGVCLLTEDIITIGGFIRYGKRFIRDLKKYISDEDRTVIIVSHSIETLSELCDRVIWMHDGEIREIGEPEDVLEHYKEFMNG